MEKEQRQKAEKEQARRDSLAAAGVPDTSLTKPQVTNDKVVPRRPGLVKNQVRGAVKRAKEIQKKEVQKKKEESP